MTFVKLGTVLIATLVAAATLAFVAPTASAADRMCTTGEAPCDYYDLVCVYDRGVIVCVPHPCPPTICDPFPVERVLDLVKPLLP